MKAQLFLITIISVFIFSCSNEKINPQLVDFYNKKLISTDQIDSREQVLQSNSKLLNFRESLFTSISGRLLLAHKSQISLFVYSSNINLDGSSIVIKAIENKPGSLAIKLFTLENRAFTLCELPYAMSDNGTFSLDFQFDNLIQGGRVVVWNRYKSPFNRGQRSDEIYSLATSSCSSQNKTVINSFGLGTTWGVIIKNAKLYSIERKIPYEL